jgi:Na+-transporting NADH:ubiquinone oxidoreductase subunit B
MKVLRDLLDKQKPLFEKGGKLERFYYLFEAGETFLFVPKETTPKTGSVQIRDAVDLKRMMITVVVAMIPCLLFGIWNVGHQHFISTGVDATLLEKVMIGLKVTLPVVIVAYAAGGLVEVVFGIIRKHPINEGFLVTGMLIPLVMPPTIPLWQVALATIFAVIIAKEAFGGTGLNILNVALTARAFLYFAYPSQISGEVWTFFGDKSPVDGYSGATALAYGADAATKGTDMMASMNGHWYDGMFSFFNMFMGAIPGSIGETSTLMCLIGAAILIGTGVGSWKIIVSVFFGAWAMGAIFNLVGGDPFMAMPAHYHLVIGGLAFGAVFMATDPVSAAQTEAGKWIYGILIGVITVLIRVVNPAYPEGIMLAILFMNVFAP